MREILFRGKRCDNGEWVQGFYIRADHHWHKHGIHKDWIALGASANGGWFALHNKYPVNGETLGQYTGLTDKNGQRIFEGDIISIRFESDYEPPSAPIVGFEYAKVIWNSEYLGWFASFEAGYEFSMCEYDVSYDAAVIGNIHDNPELLVDGGEEDA